jgi:hypothetical protein
MRIWKNIGVPWLIERHHSGGALKSFFGRFCSAIRHGWSPSTLSKENESFSFIGEIGYQISTTL